MSICTPEGTILTFNIYKSFYNIKFTIIPDPVQNAITQNFDNQ